MTKATKKAATNKTTEFSSNGTTFDVLPHLIQRATQSGELQQCQNGYILMRRDAKGREEYCGEGMAWRKYPFVHTPFDSQEKAEICLQLHRQQHERTQQERSGVECYTATVEIPFVNISDRQSSGQVCTMCSPVEHWAFKSLRKALELSQTRDIEGRLVDSDSATLRWLLQRLFLASGKSIDELYSGNMK